MSSIDGSISFLSGISREIELIYFTERLFQLPCKVTKLKMEYMSFIYIIFASIDTSILSEHVTLYTSKQFYIFPSV